MSSNKLPVFATEFIESFIKEQQNKFNSRSETLIDSAVKDFINSNKNVIVNSVLDKLKEVHIDFTMPECHPIINKSNSNVSECIIQSLQECMAADVTTLVGTFETEIVKKIQLVLETEVRALLVEKMTNVFSPDRLKSLFGNDVYALISSTCVEKHREGFTQRLSEIIFNFSTDDNDYVPSWQNIRIPFDVGTSTSTDVDAIEATDAKTFPTAVDDVYVPERPKSASTSRWAWRPDSFDDCDNK